MQNTGNHRKIDYEVIHQNVHNVLSEWWNLGQILFFSFFLMLLCIFKLSGIKRHYFCKMEKKLLPVFIKTSNQIFLHPGPMTTRTAFPKERKGRQGQFPEEGALRGAPASLLA